MPLINVQVLKCNSYPILLNSNINITCAYSLKELTRFNFEYSHIQKDRNKIYDFLNITVLSNLKGKFIDKRL